jgi:hypothetical protein
MSELRGSTAYVADQKLSQLTVAEIGVREGLNAVRILEKLDVKCIYLIDNYPIYDDGGVIRENEEQETHYKEMFENLHPYFKKSVLIHQPSTFASSLFTDRFFDVVYIDGDHSYENVKNDLAIWWNKVKIGGFLTGHDYANGYLINNKMISTIGVVNAVDEFVKNNNLDIIYFSDTDYLIKKLK